MNNSFARKAGFLKNSFSNARVAQDFDKQIEVDFAANVPAGRFCYDICLYDASNNVSQIQSVCLTVEAWGGNASIVGEWILDREEPDDDKETINCTNGQTMEVDYEQNTREEVTIAFNEDGTFFQMLDREGRNLDYSASESNCSASYNEVVELENEKNSGNWAYNEENQTLTLVYFKFENLLDASENRDFYGNLKAEIISGQLVLTETVEGETYTYYLNRK